VDAITEQDPQTTGGADLPSPAWPLRLTVVATVGALVLGLIRLGRLSFWYDEAYTIGTVDRPLGDALWRITHWELNQAPFYALMTVWHRLGEGDVHRATVFSLQGFATATADDIVTEPGAGPEEMLLRRERFGYLQHAVDALPERLRVVVRRYFFEERPMAEIAADLGVSESRVSQLRAEALVLLRDGLNTHLDPALAAQDPPKEGCVARRRAAYYDKIASRGTLQTRLALTSLDGLPVRAA